MCTYRGRRTTLIIVQAGRQAQAGHPPRVRLEQVLIARLGACLPFHAAAGACERVRAKVSSLLALSDVPVRSDFLLSSVANVTTRWTLVAAADVTQTCAPVRGTPGARKCGVRWSLSDLLFGSKWGCRGMIWEFCESQIETCVTLREPNLLSVFSCRPTVS